MIETNQFPHLMRLPADKVGDPKVESTTSTFTHWRPEMQSVSTQLKTQVSNSTLPCRQTGRDLGILRQIPGLEPTLSADRPGPRTTNNESK